jgi:hypothetical protein
MANCRSPYQPDLFGVVQSSGGTRCVALLQEPPPADFIERIRRELTNTLTMVRDSAALPWGDLTAATLAELRFDSIANWLPDAEAIELRECFAREMARLWAIAERDAQEAP